MLYKFFVLFLPQTSIVFTLEEGPGMLFKALAVFALRGISLSKVNLTPKLVSCCYSNSETL